ncbi:uncharacterized protein CTRU02_201041 [Colletotrichum truncatum]|uniref:Uncharacterized protein n=1 Tax=Colletotrichum truncatum TaxID=5467 RepID=A0ACC3ZGM5_COLTU|nr:uncharacterized protein CTRU02_12353 [Colletotrichum truncatum]KAF6784648.1 hypothetical protein CTRU02_12353 [Colletotrichum truncatum]
MDDPWGSPWATTDNVTAPSTSPSKTILEPPPAAFLSTPSNLTLPSSQSPWLEDDAFGDWASPDPARAANASPWAWGNEVTPIEQLTPSYEPRRKSSTPKWPRSRSASPGLRVPITPNANSPGRLSPDPWAAFNSDEPEPIAQLPHIPDIPPTVLENPQIELEPDTPRQIPKDDIISDGTATLQFDDSITEDTPSPYPFATAASDNSPVAPGQHDDAATSSASTTYGDDDELPDATHVDSPITSIEDSPLPKSIKKKASSKVQSLVEMYDGIAKRTIITPERQVPPRRSVSREADTSADDTSIHDSEDVQAENDDSTLTPPSLITTKPATEDLSDDRDNVANEWEEARKSKLPDHDPFVVDLSVLDSLIPEPTIEKPQDAGEVSDRIITDSFTGISERKMWYRLSRHESLRKFNVGDDDNYVRISWSNSTMRDETMQIVRRWMEEDSMGGRAFRGGLAGKAGGKFFGWDSTTESSPVDLDRVFGRKQKRQAPLHRPTHSIGALPSLSTAPMVPSSKESTPASAQPKDNWEGLASFGWSTGASDTKASAEGKAPERPKFVKPLPLGFAGFDNTPKSHASLPAAFAASKPIVPKTPTVDTSVNQQDDAEEDDEWGDMVSPTTAEATDSMSIPKTSWDSFSTNPLPDSTAFALSDSTGSGGYAKPEGLGTGNKTAEESKSGMRDIGNVISPAPASTSAAFAGMPPQSQGGFINSPESTSAFTPASTVKPPADVSIVSFTDPPAPSSNKDGKPGVSAVELLGTTPLTTGLGISAAAQPRNSIEDSDLVQQIVRNLPNLSYMLK